MFDAATREISSSIFFLTQEDVSLFVADDSFDAGSVSAVVDVYHVSIKINLHPLHHIYPKQGKSIAQYLLDTSDQGDTSCLQGWIVYDDLCLLVVTVK